ncbi:hypothetical protein S7711_04168 [Stachybotrys chartarum IBT 7711]|uniref:NAD dependent epimerase/dehydratase n=1 Tax=Stachybotrys chartarum (strain CBS 109288 / IBT 7711) TaxID=1280523 RepID=A0A084B6M3_STACB|nr:hypothetical protein S7711_04168 [Stachybotrys chartarum IBT 7711]KFA56666.1 hypothetical protein S40293_06247 [Stachybotrys chartarum IBT 40293]
MPPLNGWFFRFVEYMYSLPEPPKRKRTRPMEVICLGMPRTGTESLQHALLSLGYDHTYHGWDINFENPNYAQQWVRLCQKKWFGPPSGEVKLTAEDFDAVMGHAVAVADAPASVFAAELIEAYPEAKIILNYRKDIDEWHQSLCSTLARGPTHVFLFLLSCLDKECFWNWHCYLRYMWPGLFRSLDGNAATGMKRCGKWVYKAHYSMIRGMVPKERMLEWCVDDGWEPLCKFLDRPVPDEPFPHVNSAAGFEGQEKKLGLRYIKGAMKNLTMLSGLIAVGVAAFTYPISW